LIAFVVIAAKYQDQWIFCRHKQRQTWEIPGGHREIGETVDVAARRELWEETGAEVFALESICTYSVVRAGEKSYGKLFYAEVETLGNLPPEMEIGELCFCEEMPKKLTYPLIQPILMQHVISWMKTK